MPPIHEHEKRLPRANPEDSDPTWRAALELAPLPLLFGLVYLAWPFGEPRPWWALAGLALYGGMAAWAVSVAARGTGIVRQRRAISAGREVRSGPGGTARRR